ncbi:MAG: lysylphosphatidylglycerol synthase transmembrane domain-containing protein, partial [Sedimentisphaerales bacterium]
FVAYFNKINIWLFLGVLGVYAAGQAIIGLRWWILLRTQSIYISYWAAVRLHFLGLFYNNFMPSSVGGDFIRAWYVTKHTDKRFEAALSVFVDRIIGLLSTVIIAVFFYVVFLQRQSVHITTSEQKRTSILESLSRHSEILFWLTLALAAIFIGFLLNSKGRRMLGKLWAYLLAFSYRKLVQFKNAIIIYFTRPLAILTVFWLTVLMQLMVITGFWFLGQNMGLGVGIKYYYVFFTLAWVLGAVPVSIGGAGVVEAFLVLLFVNIAGLDEGGAWALALCQRAIWMLSSLPGALIHLLGAHLPKEFFVDYNDVSS